MLPNHHFILATRIAEHGNGARHDQAVRYLSTLHHHGHDDPTCEHPTQHSTDVTNPDAATERTIGRLLSHLVHRPSTTGHAHAA